MSNWTIEDFQKEIEVANHEEKKELLIRFMDNFDVFENKDMLLKWRSELTEIKEQSKIEDDIKCRKDIEQGEVELYKCIKSIKNYKEGEEYYAKIYDSLRHLKTSGENISKEVDNYLSKAFIFIIREDNNIYSSRLFMPGEDNAIETFNEHFIK